MGTLVIRPENVQKTIKLDGDYDDYVIGVNCPHCDTWVETIENKNDPDYNKIVSPDVLYEKLGRAIAGKKCQGCNNTFWFNIPKTHTKLWEELYD